MKIQTILCPVDFSDCSKDALPYAKSFAESQKAGIILLHVVEPYVLPIEYGLAPIPYVELEAEAKKNAIAQLEKIGKQFFSGMKVEYLVGAGRSSEVILETAKNRKADMIIVSTHGRTGFSHLFLGSTAEKVVRQATCPVLTVRSQPKK